MLARMRRKGHPLTLLVEMQSGIAIVEDRLVISYKIKYTLAIQPNNYAPWYLLK